MCGYYKLLLLIIFLEARDLYTESMLCKICWVTDTPRVYKLEQECSLQWKWDMTASVTTGYIHCNTICGPYDLEVMS